MFENTYFYNNFAGVEKEQHTIIKPSSFVSICLSAVVDMNEWLPETIAVYYGDVETIIALKIHDFISQQALLSKWVCRAAMKSQKEFSAFLTAFSSLSETVGYLYYRNRVSGMSGGTIISSDKSKFVLQDLRDIESAIDFMRTFRETNT